MGLDREAEVARSDASNVRKQLGIRNER
jgi:hypothetical protein